MNIPRFHILLIAAVLVIAFPPFIKPIEATHLPENDSNEKYDTSYSNEDDIIYSNDCPCGCDVAFSNSENSAYKIIQIHHWQQETGCGSPPVSDPSSIND